MRSAEGAEVFITALQGRKHDRGFPTVICHAEGAWPASIFDTPKYTEMAGMGMVFQVGLLSFPVPLQERCTFNHNFHMTALS